MIALGVLSDSKSPINAWHLIPGMKSITGFASPTWMLTHPDKLPGMITEIVNLLHTKTIQLPSLPFDYEEFKQAVAASQNHPAARIIISS